MPNKVVEKYTLLLSSSEVGLGSLLHGLHLPLAGHFLSINQSVLLTLASQESQQRKLAFCDCSLVSVLSAALKLLSPMGKKITPMIAIALQGVFYSLSLLL